MQNGQWNSIYLLCIVLQLYGMYFTFYKSVWIWKNMTNYNFQPFIQITLVHFSISCQEIFTTHIAL